MKRLIRNAKVLYHGELMEKEVLFDENRILQIDDHIEADPWHRRYMGFCICRKSCQWKDF